ncbi:MAG: polyamine aminopropyltransferase, partial [Gammaproteobacteria bacterium]|nr:polyamine aminopropyltransferase [Gammaproteobacteria bacterium]
MSTTSEKFQPMTGQQEGILLVSIMIVALCGIIYELIIGTVSSYLLGNSVYQFSLTIGFFMFAMGIGSLFSKYFSDQYVLNFIRVEIAIALIGGICSLLLFMAFPMARAMYEFVMYSLILIIGSLVG